MSIRIFGRLISALLFSTIATYHVASSAEERGGSKTDAPMASSITRTPYGAWELVCETHSEMNKPAPIVKVCQIHTTIVIADSQTKQDVVAAVVAIEKEKVEKNAKMRAIIQVPLSATLNQPVVLGGNDGKMIAKLDFVACQPQLCTAMVPLSDKEVQALIDLGEKISVSYVNQQGQTVKVDALTKGLAEALKALSR